jgi:hypothetical protein
MRALGAWLNTIFALSTGFSDHFPKALSGGLRFAREATRKPCTTVLMFVYSKEIGYAAALNILA